MPISNDIRDREYQKFTETTGGDVAVRTVLDATDPVAVIQTLTDAIKAENDISHELLKSVLIELKMIKTHLELITEVGIKENDLN